MKAIADYRQKFFDEWYQFNSAGFFGMLCLLYWVMYFLKRVFVLDSIAAFEVLQDRGEMWVFDLFFGLQYVSVPIFLAWKFTLTAFVTWVGCFMFGYRVTFNELWRWVMFSELIFILPEFLKFLWFLVVANDPSYQDIVAFYPLSMINLVDVGGLDSRWHYPLKALNIFEPLYWLALTIGVFYLSKKKWKISVYIVLSSYVLFFILWLIFYLLVYN